MRTIAIVLGFIFGLMFCVGAYADIIHVPGDYPTIQAAINAAQAGDTVMVAAGTYNEHIVMKQGVKLLGTGGGVRTPDNSNDDSIIAGQSNGRVVQVHYCSLPTAVSGFTIVNGSASNGAGISIINSIAQISNNYIRNNIANAGGGIYIAQEANRNILIDGNRFRENRANGSNGGGIYVENQAATRIKIVRNIFENNFAANKGGAIFSVDIGGSNRFVAILNNIITGNTARHEGGGIFCEYKARIIKNNLIINNIAGADGQVAGMGGGIHCNWMNGAPIRIINNTIVSNAAIGPSEDWPQGGGIYVVNSTASLGLRNNIIVSNTAAFGSGIRTYNVPNQSLIYSDIYNNTAEGIPLGTGCIQQNPRFVANGEQFGNYYLSQTASGQSQDSPCVDAGDATARAWELSMLTTRTNSQGDEGMVDMGYHYKTSAHSLP